MNEKQIEDIAFKVLGGISPKYLEFAQAVLAAAGKSANSKPVGHVVTWDKGGSGEVNSIEPIGKSGYSLAASLPEGTLIYLAAPSGTEGTQAAPEEVRNQALADEVIGCFRAAEVEGLADVLANTSDERLKDLVERRLMHALYAAQTASEQGCQVAPAQWKSLVDKAVDVLQRHAPPDGLSDSVALTELYGIFDGPEYRAMVKGEQAVPSEPYEIFACPEFPALKRTPGGAA